MNKKIIKILISCLVVGAVCTGGYFAYTKYTSKNVKVMATSYRTTKVTKTNLSVNVQATGTVFASVTKDVVANNNGEIKNLTVKEGSVVKAGDTLFQSYTSDLSDKVTKAEIDLKKQQLQLESAKSDSETELQNLNVEQAQKTLNDAVAARNKMNVTSPISGTVVTRNNNNGDSIQSGKAVLQVVDTNSLKIKVKIDELDVAKIKAGQKAEIKFDAIDGKTYEGQVETIAQLGETTNNVTTYDVVVSISDMTGVKIGMNASVNIITESKENVIAVPVEALVEQNGSKYVRVESSESTETEDSKEETKKEDSTDGNKEETKESEGQEENTEGKAPQNSGNNMMQRRNSNTSSEGKLVKVETGIENETYVEITSGLSEGQNILIAMPKATTTTTNNSDKDKKGFNNMMGNQMPMNRDR